MAILTVDQREIEVTHPNKMLYPDVSVTKREVMEYYDRIGEYMVPHVEDRPLSLHRFPHGVAGEGFFQKNIPDSFPEWLRTVKTPKKEGHNVQAVGDAASVMVYLAGQYTLEFHGWLSRAAKLRYPDKIVFDLDPPTGSDMSHVVLGARLVREVLESVGLRPYVMNTGSKGLHVAAALDQGATFKQVKAFAKSVAQCLSVRYDDMFTIEHRIAKRRGRIFFDFLRNEYAQTSIAPYSLRARAVASVATPLEWDELSDSLDPQEFTIKNIFRRLSHRDDPWSDFFEQPGSLAAAQQGIDEVLSEICPV